MGDKGKRDEELFRTTVLDVLKMLENDYLGGGGSRGNGKIKFIDLKDEKGQPI
jgi:CRISPR-associated protein Csm3